MDRVPLYGSSREVQAPPFLVDDSVHAGTALAPKKPLCRAAVAAICSMSDSEDELVDMTGAPDEDKSRPTKGHGDATLMIVKMQEASTRDVEAQTGIPKSNLSRWMRQATQLLSFGGTKKRFNLDGAGRPEEIPNTAELEAFMHKLRDAEKPVTCTHIVNFLKRNQKE
ncbi:hypothetical protein DYB32_007506 [Aphanomyces invadans]|uniref:Uncharacterized protein n=1 Tax=Aphanomyces invadans TaxID=157072 RepID=A0A3R6VTD4_9STRA|nr:hypothetical protein DYB32_007506 [Aphanomyces invadans]